MMGYYGWHGMGWFGMVFGLLLSIALLVGLVYLIVWVVRRASGNPGQGISLNSNVQSARDIAQTRYAKGEISRDEYQQILLDLGR